MTATALIVDDNRLNTNLARHMFKRLGWLAEVADSGDAALALLAERSFDLVLLDLRMPGLGGEEVCRRIRTDPGLAALPVVAYTAHGMSEERERMLAAGFSGLLIKPISFDDVRRVCAEFAVAVVP